ncbi:MAG TPA: phage head-tail connector protein [Lachnospiraceae bacterium]|nr:phage head-tail connector protein [Lachnospiraceae bacterium]
MELVKLKQLLGLDIADTSKDKILSFVIGDIQDIILDYCHIDAIPSGLENTAYRMAIDLYRNENLGHEESALGSVSSISEGDTSTSFKESVDSNFKDTLMKNYKSRLNRYRRLVWT